MFIDAVALASRRTGRRQTTARRARDARQQPSQQFTRVVKHHNRLDGVAGDLRTVRLATCSVSLVDGSGTPVASLGAICWLRIGRVYFRSTGTTRPVSSSAMT